MDRLNDYCLISIFKHLDLPSRFQASKTCKLWRALLQDSEALLDDIGEVYLNEWTPDEDKSEVQSVLAVLSNLRKCRQLKLGPGLAHEFLSEQRLNDELGRFDNVVIIPKKGRWDDSLVPCLSLLPSTVTRLKIDVCVPDGFSLSLPDSVQLEALNLTFCDLELETGSFVLPSTLSTYGYSCICPYTEAGRVFTSYYVSSAPATYHFLNSFPVGPSLTDLKIRGLYFDDKTISYFLRMIRDDSQNLHRISFQDVGFEFKDFDSIMKEFSVDEGTVERLLPVQRIEFENSLMHWDGAIWLLLHIADLKTIVINLRRQSASTADELAAVYALTPAIKEKGAKLELTMNENHWVISNPMGCPNNLKNYRLHDLSEILVPFELSGVLSKLDLLRDGYRQLLQVMFGGDDSFELLTEIQLEGCDAALKIVAKWCKNLKKLKFQPHLRECDGDVITDQCLQPFMDHWNDRKSVRLSIECLKPAQPFNGFGLPCGQEKGVFDDGKKWMLFRKASLLDGCDEKGTRLLIWDDQIDSGGKSMVITDYEKKFEINVQISVADGKCIVKQKRGMEFQVHGYAY